MKLSDYIAANYGGNQKAFAEAQGVQPPQVTQWIKKKFIVVDGVLYSPRRKLKKGNITPSLSRPPINTGDLDDDRPARKPHHRNARTTGGSA